MNNPQIHAALVSLLPTYPTTLFPTPLTDLAAALHAQSRSAVAGARIKPEEEAARPYACAHLAVERLKGRLNLPTIEPRPPCNPRVYTKLFAFLEKALTPIPRKRKAIGVDDTIHNTHDERETPVGRGMDSVISATTPKSSGVDIITQSEIEESRKRLPARSTRGKRAQKLDEEQQGRAENRIDQEQSKNAKENVGIGSTKLPFATAKAIRHLCRAFSVPEAVPHVYAGVTTILYPNNSKPKRGRPKSPEEGGIRKSQMPSLVIAVSFVIYERMFENFDMNDRDDTAADALVASGLITSEEKEDCINDVHSFLQESKENWRQSEWYRNTPADASEEIGNSGGDSDEEPLGPKKVDNAIAIVGMVHYGIGTMRQAKTDWLSDDKCLAYLRWKADMMKRIGKAKTADASITK